MEEQAKNSFLDDLVESITGQHPTAASVDSNNKEFLSKQQALTLPFNDGLLMVIYVSLGMLALTFCGMLALLWNEKEVVHIWVLLFSTVALAGSVHWWVFNLLLSNNSRFVTEYKIAVQNNNTLQNTAIVEDYHKKLE